MATETLPGSLGEARASSTASGGTALTTTATLIPVLDGTVHLTLIPRNFSTAVVVRWAKNPYLLVVKTTDEFVTGTDYSAAAQDGSTDTDVVLSSLGTAAQGDYLMVGSHLPFRGVRIDVDAANANASVLTVKYRKSDDTWADITATDGTASGGATMAQDGNVTWTMPTDWKPVTLREAVSGMGSPFPYGGHRAYWTRWEVSAALDSSTTLNSLMALNRSTVYAEIPSGLGKSEVVTKGPGGIGCIEALTDAGTANLLVICESAPNTGLV